MDQGPGTATENSNDSASSVDSSGGGATAGSSDSGIPDDAGAGGALLGCPDDRGCIMLLAAQTLDDRVEVFVPDHSDAAYRGAIALDLKPNECAGCGPGDNGSGRLDEPFGVTRHAGFVHVLTGHYPTRQEGGLVSFPLDFFRDYPVTSTVAVSDYFSNSQFVASVIGRSLGEVEPIFLHVHASGRLVVGVFNNDLFAGEDTWTQSGRLLVIDPKDPGGEVGRVTLDGLNGGACHGASQVIELGNDRLAVACDGNEVVALLDATGLGQGSVAEAAERLGAGVRCAVPGAMPGKRVRYLAPDDRDGFVVAEGPTALDITGNARLWAMGPDCSLRGNLSLSDEGAPGDWQLGEIVRLPSSVPAWLVAAGSAAPMGLRGVFVIYQEADQLLRCPAPLAGFETAWDDGAGGTIEPFALALTEDGTRLAVGASPLIPDPAGVGYGKVLWASLAGADPCSLSATTVDLTDGGAGHAPVSDPSDPSTFRRGANVVVIQEISG